MQFDSSSNRAAPAASSFRLYCTGSERRRIGGKVVRWLKDKGFGFIEGPDGTSYFVHSKTLPTQQPLPVGGLVEFLPDNQSGKWRALNVTAVGGGPPPIDRVPGSVASPSTAKERPSLGGKRSTFSPHPAWNFVDQRGVGGAGMMDDVSQGASSRYRSSKPRSSRQTEESENIAQQSIANINSMGVKPLCEEDLDIIMKRGIAGTLHPGSRFYADMAEDLKLFDFEPDEDISKFVPKKLFMEELAEKIMKEKEEVQGEQPKTEEGDVAGSNSGVTPAPAPAPAS